MLTEILKRVNALEVEIRKHGSTAWYRGHRRSEWPLKSTLHRHVERLTSELDVAFSVEEKRALFRDEYRSLYRRFKREAWPLLNPIESSDWGIIFTMQHYKLPTSLLDWTESFACALFFAQWHRQPLDSAAVWVLDSERLNQVSVERNGLIALDETNEPAVFDVWQYHPKWTKPPEDLVTIAVSPLYTNPRMTAQRSGFTLMGDSFLSLESQLEGRLTRDGIIEKIELPPETFNEIEEYLHFAGISTFTYFPDLEGLALDHEARVETTLRDARNFYPNQVKRQ